MANISAYDIGGTGICLTGSEKAAACIIVRGTHKVITNKLYIESDREVADVISAPIEHS